MNFTVHSQTYQLALRALLDAPLPDGRPNWYQEWYFGARNDALRDAMKRDGVPVGPHRPSAILGIAPARSGED
jgi:hypothetical protein